MRVTWVAAVAWMCLAGCSDDEGGSCRNTDSCALSAHWSEERCACVVDVFNFDSGADAAKADASAHDAQVGDARGSLDARVDAAAAACTEAQAYLAAHRSCAVDGDCTIVGSCSGGFGFYAVEQSAKERAQRYSDEGACGPVYDGPLFEAVCEQGRCGARGTGHWCGEPPPDASVPGRCQPGEEQYQLACDASVPTCATRCTGAGDTSCASGLVCTQTRVSRALPPYGVGCDEDFIPVWLCR